jgi:sterol desaturase/sphingolipid hydroxylase (fatty acid hydroxylase superfamily)
MEWLWYVFLLAASFGFYVVLFRPLEVTFPAQPGQPFLRPAWSVDVAFFVGYNAFWNGWILWCISYVNLWLTPYIPARWHEWLIGQPWWLQAGVIVFLSDLCVYWGHRLQHSVDLLWRFHAVHHSSEHLDWLAAHREHPLDGLYTIGLLNVPVLLLGFPTVSLAGLVAFRGIWAIYIHSNVRLPIGPLRWLIGAPELHHWHHDRERQAGNYANLSPLMDILFGTYKCPDHEPERVGINETTPTTYLGYLLWPFWRSQPQPTPTPPVSAGPQ